MRRRQVMRPGHCTVAQAGILWRCAVGILAYGLKRSVQPDRTQKPFLSFMWLLSLGLFFDNTRKRQKKPILPSLTGHECGRSWTSINVHQRVSTSINVYGEPPWGGGEGGITGQEPMPNMGGQGGSD